MTTDLNAPGVLKALGAAVLKEIDSAAVSLYDEGPRKHLGGSLIGDECYRKIFYGFRWVKYTHHEGRQLRLFNRGHKEEPRFVEWLTHAGFKVQELDPTTGKQWRVSGVMGHLGGSLDGIAYWPDKYEIATPMLLEFKTNSTGAGFKELLARGCALAKPVHFDQQSFYGYKLGLTHSIYLNVCKNDDNIHSEVIALDHKRGEDLEKKAAIIILAEEPPKRISENPTYFACKWCDFRGVCHEGLPYDRNCRSCTFSRPIEDKAWRCLKWSATIPDDVIAKGCEQWSPLT